MQKRRKGLSQRHRIRPARKHEKVWCFEEGPGEAGAQDTGGWALENQAGEVGCTEQGALVTGSRSHKRTLSTVVT